MQFGDLLCMKTTGELVYVLGVYEVEGQRTTVDVRRPVMGRAGISHPTNGFFADELETPEQHLRHEAKEMMLKANIQREVLDAANTPEEATKTVDISVN